MRQTLWQEADLNRRPRAYESPALPTELSCQNHKHHQIILWLRYQLPVRRSFSEGGSYPANIDVFTC